MPCHIALPCSTQRNHDAHPTPPPVAGGSATGQNISPKVQPPITYEIQDGKLQAPTKWALPCWSVPDLTDGDGRVGVPVSRSFCIGSCVVKKTMRSFFWFREEIRSVVEWSGDGTWLATPRGDREKKYS